MNTKTEAPIVTEIFQVMKKLVGKDAAKTMIDSAKEFDDPSNAKEFLENCTKVFSELIGAKIAEKKLQPLKEKYNGR